MSCPKRAQLISLMHNTLPNLHYHWEMSACQGKRHSVPQECSTNPWRDEAPGLGRGVGTVQHVEIDRVNSRRPLKVLKVKAPSTRLRAS